MDMNEYEMMVDFNEINFDEILTFLENELKSKDESISALKADKAKLFCYEAKYGQFGLAESLCGPPAKSDVQTKQETCTKKGSQTRYADPLTKLDFLVDTQHMASSKLKEQLSVAADRYRQVSDNLVDVKAANVSSQAEQDCKLDGFQKDIQEFYEKIELEKKQNDRLSKSLESVLNNIATCIRYKNVVQKLVQKRIEMANCMSQTCQQVVKLEEMIHNENAQVRTLERQLSSVSKNYARYLDASERRQSEVDYERERLLLSIRSVEEKNRKLEAEFEKTQAKECTFVRSLELPNIAHSFSPDRPPQANLVASLPDRSAIQSHKLGNFPEKDPCSSDGSFYPQSSRSSVVESDRRDGQQRYPVTSDSFGYHPDASSQRTVLGEVANPFDLRTRMPGNLISNSPGSSSISDFSGNSLSTFHQSMASAVAASRITAALSKIPRIPQIVSSANVTNPTVLRGSAFPTFSRSSTTFTSTRDTDKVKTTTFGGVLPPRTIMMSSSNSDKIHSLCSSVGDADVVRKAAPLFANLK